MTSSPRSSRRQFLSWSLAAAGLSVLALGGSLAVPAWRARTLALARRIWNARRRPTERLLAHFEYLRVPAAVAQRYVDDYSAHVQSLSRTSELREDFYLRFLLSTDFFAHGGDETRELAYVSLYGPSITPCYNPLAKLD